MFSRLQVACLRLAVVEALMCTTTTAAQMERAEVRVCVRYLLMSEQAADLPLEFFVEDLVVLHGCLQSMIGALPTEMQTPATELSHELQQNMDRIYGD